MGLFDKFSTYIHPLTKLQREREALIKSKKCPQELLFLFEEPIPEIETEITKINYLSIDFETTGLNSMMDNILSVGAVPIDDYTICLEKAWHHFVAKQDIKEETAVINHIVPQMLDNADTLDEVMFNLFKMMQGRAIIAHGAMIEKRFISYYLAIRYKMKSFPLLWLDTLKIEQSFMVIQDPNEAPNFQLNYVREKNYHLPEYIAHNALIDSISAGELFLAQMHRLFGKEFKALGEIYKRSV